MKILKGALILFFRKAEFYGLGFSYGDGYGYGDGSGSGESESDWQKAGAEII